MIYHFEEHPVTINGLTYLADGEVEYEWSYKFDEPFLLSICVNYLVDIDGGDYSDGKFLAEDILVEEFYTADNSLCKLVEEHWSEMQ